MVNLFRSAWFVLSVIALCMVVPSASLAEEIEKTNTVMTVSEMCGGCVKKITTRFDDEKDVAKVECSIDKKTVTLIPKEGIKLNAKKMWEIMEGISKTPTKLVSPEGTFTSKPK